MLRKSPQGHKLRLGRFSETNRAYLITTVTHRRQPYFKDLFLARIVVHAMQYQHQQQHLNSMAYVIMPDHLHWLIQLNEKSQLNDIMRCFKGYSALTINRKLGSSNRVWQAGYHDHGIRDERVIQSIARYIVANPLRSGLVKRIEDYALWDAIWL